jgi:hypothetical protein
MVAQGGADTEQEISLEDHHTHFPLQTKYALGLDLVDDIEV